MNTINLNEDLFSSNEELNKIVDEIMKAAYHPNDDIQFFTMFCLAKASKTYRAVMLLCKQGYGQDAAILGRSLVDLLITLAYIQNDPTGQRMERYFAYDWILRKKMFGYFKDKPELLRAVSAEELSEVETQAKLAQEKYKFGHVSWSEDSIREMAEEIGRINLYLTVYRLQSQIAHTASRSMNEYFMSKGDGYTIDVSQNSSWVSDSLVVAYDCLYHITLSFNRLFELGDSSHLIDLTDRYLEAVGIAKERPF